MVLGDASSIARCRWQPIRDSEGLRPGCAQSGVYHRDSVMVDLRALDGEYGLPCIPPDLIDLLHKSAGQDPAMLAATSEETTYARGLMKYDRIDRRASLSSVSLLNHQVRRRILPLKR